MMIQVTVHETKSERTRKRVLDAAAAVFSEQGYGARLADIAARADMKAGSLYYHFDSREDLVDEVLRLGIEGSWDRVAAAVGRLPSSSSPLDRVAAAIRAHTLSIVGRSAYASAQAAGQIDGDVDLFVARMLAFGAMNWTSEWFVAGKGMSADDLADQTVRMFLHGVASA